MEPLSLLNRPLKKEKCLILRKHIRDVPKLKY